MKINYEQVSSIPIGEKLEVNGIDITKEIEKFGNSTLKLPIGGVIVEREEWLNIEGERLAQDTEGVPDQLKKGSPIDYPNELDIGEILVVTGNTTDIIYPLRVSTLKQDVDNRVGPTALNVETPNGKQYYLYREAESEYKLLTKADSSLNGFSVTLRRLPTIYTISMLENKEKITEFNLVYNEKYSD